ncbi:hypothetical protein [Aminipila sp.]|nr:hypothetical protein [Aminipila sp.]
MSDPTITPDGLACASCVACLTCGACGTSPALIGAAGLINSTSLGKW